MRECTGICGAYSRTTSAPTGVSFGVGARRVREQINVPVYRARKPLLPRHDLVKTLNRTELLDVAHR